VLDKRHLRKYAAKRYLIVRVNPFLQRKGTKQGRRLSPLLYDSVLEDQASAMRERTLHRTLDRNKMTLVQVSIGLREEPWFLPPPGSDKGTVENHSLCLGPERSQAE
jgi:hypothetical protein